MDKKRKATIEANKVSEMLTLDLGGHPQKVLVEGKNDTLPVVIVFHGGPGLPIPFNCGGRGAFKDFTDRFIMVFWDQYGCGINTVKGELDVTIDLYIRMAEDLVHQIKAKFPDSKIILFGQAFGTVLTAYAARDLKGEVDGVVAFGQNLKHVLFNSEVFDALRHSKISKSQLEKFENLDKEKMTQKELTEFYKAVNHYTDSFHNHKSKNERRSSAPFLKTILQSPDYHLKDAKAIFSNPLHFHVGIWKELLNLDIAPVLNEVEIPYLIIIGDTDYIVGVHPLMDYVTKARKNNLYYYTAFNCGHIPNTQAVDMSCRTLRLLKKELLQPQK